MVRRSLYLAAIFVFVSGFIASLLFAETADEGAAKLRDVRMKKEVATNNYNKELAKINREVDDKIEGFRVDFHAKRDTELKDRNAKLDKLRGDYKAEIAPLNQEEKRLIESMPGSTANFAKPKSCGDK